ncbi:hypothetical protein [Singulisphaera sp. PoT]|uniref:hypothetical protein n=1 Tax=Singulisphaera sp. PoT TaxID=3411797 RepID=UPI003BF575CF
MILRVLLASLAGLFAMAEGPKMPPKDIYRVWVHSDEEDTEDFEVYRPESFDFPPARGRDGFEVKRGGAFVLREIGPADGIEEVDGKWEFKPADALSVTFPDAKPREILPGEFIAAPGARTYRIEGCDEGILRIRKKAADKSPRRSR